MIDAMRNAPEVKLLHIPRTIGTQGHHGDGNGARSRSDLVQDSRVHDQDEEQLANATHGRHQ